MMPGGPCARNTRTTRCEDSNTDRYPVLTLMDIIKLMNSPPRTRSLRGVKRLYQPVLSDIRCLASHQGECAENYK